MEDYNKYKCEKCNFKCNTKARWEAHIKTELHKTEKKKIRSDYKEPHKCEKCDYKHKNITNYKIHLLNNHSTKEEREKEYIYYCKTCDFGSFCEEQLNKHNETIKHKYNTTLKN